MAHVLNVVRADRADASKLLALAEPQINLHVTLLGLRDIEVDVLELTDKRATLARDGDHAHIASQSRFASQARLRWPRGHTTRPRVGTPDHQMHHHEVTRRRSVFSSVFDRIFKKVTTDRILRILFFR